jgi:hypothetical protein
MAGTAAAGVMMNDDAALINFGGEPVDYKNPPVSMSLLKFVPFEVAGTVRKAITQKVDVKALKTIYDSIEVEEITQLATTMESVTGDEVAMLAGTLFDFMGYDPETTMRVLIAINKYYQTLSLDPPETAETLKEDIMLSIACVVRMGNLQFNAIKRRASKAKSVIRYLMSKYGILIGSTGSGMASTVLTFPRIANSFPVLHLRTVNVMKMQDNTKQDFGANNLPQAMRPSSFCTMLADDMEERTRLFLIRATCAYSCDYQKTVYEGEVSQKRIARATNPYSVEDVWAMQFQILFAISSSKVPSRAMKAAVLTEFKISECYSLLKQINDNITKVLQDTFLSPTDTEFKTDMSEYISGKKIARITGST